MKAQSLLPGSQVSLPVPGPLGSAHRISLVASPHQSLAQAQHTGSHVPSQLPLLLWVSWPAPASFPKLLLQFHPAAPSPIPGLLPQLPEPLAPSQCPLLGPRVWTSLPLRCVTPKTSLLFSPCLTGPILNQQVISGEMGILRTGNLETCV